MARKYTVIAEKDEDGWLVSEVVGLPGCHTQAKTEKELMKRVKEAIELYLETIDIIKKQKPSKKKDKEDKPKKKKLIYC